MIDSIMLQTVILDLGPVRWCDKDMKKIIFITALLLAQVAGAAEQQVTVAAQPQWLVDSYTQEYGSCKLKNLFFSALRINKIALGTKWQDKDVYLRLVLFMQPDGTYTARLNEQALLGCRNNSEGEEVCTFKPLTNAWTKGSWSMMGDSVNVEGIGVLTKEGDVRYRDYQVHFNNDFSYPQAAAQAFKGPMILVNFDSNGVNSTTICSKPQ